MKRKITIEQNRDDLDKYDVFEDDKQVGYIVRKSLGKHSERALYGCGYSVCIRSSFRRI